MFESILQKIAGEFSSKKALEHLLNIYRSDRRSSYHHFHQTSDYCYRRLIESGLEKAEVIKHPADGLTRCGDWRMPLAWDVKGAELKIVEPSDEAKTLASYDEEPCSLVMGSSPTPPGGITAEAVYLKNGSSNEDYRGVRVKGKIVFTSQHPLLVKRFALRHGAVGIISDYLPIIPDVRRKGDLPDAVSRVNTWSDNYDKEDKKFFAFCISPRRGSHLRVLLRKRDIKVRAVIDTKLYTGTIDTVTGIIPGKMDEEEILGVAHLYTPGAVHNASGSALLLEAGRCLKSLIQNGRLPVPVRTIRFVFTMQCHGLLSYAAARADKCRNVLAAIRLDSAGANQSINRSLLSLVLNPPHQVFYPDLLMESVLRQYLALRKVNFKWQKVDSPLYELDSLSNVPTIILHQYPGKFSHTSLDTPDKIDNTAMECCGIPTAVFLYFLANAGYRGSCWLAKLASDNFSQRLDETVKLRYRLRFLGRRDNKWQAQSDLTQERTELTFSKLARLVPQEKRKQFSLFIKKESKKLKKEKDKKLKLSKDSEVKLSGLERKISRVFPKRLVSCPVKFDNSPRSHMKAVHGLRKEVKFLFNWVDGKRSLLEIYRRLQAVLDEELHLKDFMAGFKFLRKYGYVGLKHK